MSVKARMDKWEQYWRKHRPSLTLQVYHECAAEKIAERAKHYRKSEPLLLDAGCGQGQLSVLLAERMRCEIVAMDIIDGPLRAAKKLVEDKKLKGQVSLVRASVYQLPFRDDTFDIAVSTGSESAAGYPGASEEVSRVVVPTGSMFIDFTRMPNLYQLVSSVRSYFRYRKACKELRANEKMLHTHFGKLGLRERFEGRLGLKIEKIWNMNTSPPLGSKRLRLLFERVLGKIMSPLLARTILVELRNKEKKSEV